MTSSICLLRGSHRNELVDVFHLFYSYVKTINIEKCVKEDSEDIERKRAEIVGMGKIALDGPDAPGLMAATVTINSDASKQ